ncbi:hypothetical protein [Desulfocicer niacini]
MNIMTLLIMAPMDALGIPVALQVGLVAVLTALLSFTLRKKLRVEEKTSAFQETFSQKRERQKDLQLLENHYQRSAMYKATDDELNDDYNFYLAHHYARYVMVYLLPIFLVMAWLNGVLDEGVLMAKQGMAYALPLPVNGYGVQGISVTALFLIVYLFTLAVGFRMNKKKSDEPTK